MKRSVFIRGGGLSRDSVWRTLLARLEAGGQSFRLLVLPLLMLLSLMMGSAAWALGLEVQVNGVVTAVPITVTLVATPLLTANGVNSTTCATALAIPTAAGSFSCLSAAASGNVTLKVDKVPANYAVIWTGACSTLVPTVTPIPSAAATSSSQVIVSVPATGGSIVCAANITSINLFEVNPAAPQSGLPAANAIPLSPRSCINFGYIATGSTPITKPLVGTVVTGSTIAAAGAASITSTGILPFPLEFSVATSPTINPFVGTYNTAVLATIAGGTTYQLTTVPAGPLPNINLVFDPSKITPTTLPYTVTGKSFAVNQSNDPAVNSFNIPLVGTIVDKLASKVQVLDGSTNVVCGSGVVDLGTTIAGSPTTKTLTIKNTGTIDLTLATPTAVDVTPAAGQTASFTVPTQPTLATPNFPPAGGCPGAAAVAAVTTTFDMVLNSSTVGDYTGTATLTSNSGQTTPANITDKCTFTVKGKITAPPPISPKIALYGNAGVTANDDSSMLPNGSGVIDFGSTPVGTPVPKTITLRNIGVGPNPLNVFSFNFLGANGQPSTSFKTTGTVVNTVDQLTSSAVTLQFTPTTADSYNESVEVFSNDLAQGGKPANNPYRITIKGVGTGGTGTTGPALSISPAPTNGTVTSTPTGINCGTTCTSNFTQDASVTLTATPGTGATFTSWGGACSTSTTATATVTMDAAKTCSVTFTGGTVTPPPPTGKSKLTVKVTGTGSVASSTPTGISACTSATEATCSYDFAAGEVTLTPSPNPTTNVVWGTTCAGGKVTLDGTTPVTCDVSFIGVVTPTQSKVTITVTGTGTVRAPNTTTITNCTSAGGASCTADFNEGTVVELATEPTTNVTWGASCANGTIPVVANTPVTCTVTFGTAPVAQVKLTITPPTNGTVIAGATINCGTTCDDMINKGDSVNLIAVPATNFTFTSWGGDCTGTTNPLSLKLDVAKTCTATFTASGTVEPPPPTSYSLTISTPTGGKVTSDTGGVSCGTGSTNCTANFATGSAVNLTATPDAGATFTGWGGNCTGTVSPAALTMDAAKTCTATFTTTGGGTCSATNLSACTTEAACTGVGGTFVNNACTIAPPPTTTCSTTSLSSCTTETACGSAGGVFINNTTCTIAPVLTHPDKGTAASISNTAVQTFNAPTQFSAGVSVNGGAFMTSASAKASDVVEWAVNLTVNPAHVNQTAQLLFVIGVEPPSADTVAGYTGGVSTVYNAFDVGLNRFPVNLYANAAEWPAELAKMTTSPFKANITLGSKMSFNLRKGTLAALVNGQPRARIYTFVGYALADGTIVYNGMPIITTLE